jgi:hypothetical protein
VPVAEAIHSETWRTDALAVLAPALPQDLLGRVAEEFHPTHMPGVRFRELKVLARLSDTDRRDAINEAEELFTLIAHDDGEGAAIRLVDFAVDAGALLEEALRATTRITHDLKRAETLAQLASVATDDLATELLDAIAGIRSSQGRALALEKLLPRLQPELAPRALDQAGELGDPYWRACTLLAAIPVLPVQRDELLAQTLAAAVETTDSERRRTVLRALDAHLATLSRDRLYELWAASLPAIAGRSRADVLDDIGSLAATFRAIAGPTGVAEAIETIREVCLWIP